MPIQEVLRPAVDYGLVQLEKRVYAFAAKARDKLYQLVYQRFFAGRGTSLGETIGFPTTAEELLKQIIDSREREFHVIFDRVIGDLMVEHTPDGSIIVTVPAMWFRDP